MGIVVYSVFWVMQFRVGGLGFRGLGFWGLGVLSLGFRVLNGGASVLRFRIQLKLRNPCLEDQWALITRNPSFLRMVPLLVTVMHPFKEPV